MSDKRPYHHGDLRRSLLAAAVEIIAERGPAAVSLRDLARRAGVSHAAPTHHFRDKAGLFTALATEGHELLADFLANTHDLPDQGVRYVEFAVAHPSHFAVMYRLDLCRPDDPGLAAARTRTADALRSALPPDLSDADAERLRQAAWSIAHGFATLWLAGNLRRGTSDPAEAFRDVACLLTTSPVAADQPAGNRRTAR